jgi:hypothetical protein
MNKWRGHFATYPPSYHPTTRRTHFSNYQKSGTAILCSQSDVQTSKMTTVPEWRSAEGRRFPQYTLLFLSWDGVQKVCSGHLEVQRFLRLREGYEHRPGISDGVTLHVTWSLPRTGALIPCTSGTRARNDTGAS